MYVSYNSQITKQMDKNINSNGKYLQTFYVSPTSLSAFYVIFHRF